MNISHYIESRDEVMKILGSPTESQANKCIDHIDEACRTWIERTPFLIISTSNADGVMDVSPRGDPPGSILVLDKHTLALPDRLGNRRGDTLLNVIDNPQCSMVFMIPKRVEVVRVSGTAKVTKDPALLEAMAVKGKVPDLAIVVTVSKALFHCGKAIIRSNLWNHEKWPSIEGLPTYAQALKVQANTGQSEAELQRRITENEEQRLY